jgi:hypothetical protein
MPRSTADLQATLQDSAIRIAVEFLDDGDHWVDLNALGPEGYPNYYAGLLRPYPKIGYQSEQHGGIYIADSDDLVFDNRPLYDTNADNELIHGSAFGFFDAPFPIVIRKNSVGEGGHRFTTWFRRKVRIRVYRTEAGVEQSAEPLGIFRIEDIDRNETRATIKIVSLHKLFLDRSASDIRFGSDWYHGMPINFAIKLLAKAADPDLETCSELDDETVDLGTFEGKDEEVPQLRASSWGKVPGYATDGLPFAVHQIPRCFSDDPDTSPNEYIYVGVEWPGDRVQSTPGGALYKFHLLTGAWEQIGTTVNEWRPVAIQIKRAGDGTLWLNVCWFQEALPTPESWDFAKIHFSKTLVSTGVHYFSPVSRIWDTRYMVRKGTVIGANIYVGGIADHVLGIDAWQGESIATPFPQVIEALADLMYDCSIQAVNNQMVPTSLCWWHSFRHVTNKLANMDTSYVGGVAAQTPLPQVETDSTGFYAGYIVTDPSGIEGGGFRHSMNFHMVPPIWTYYRRDDGVSSASDRFCWLYFRNGGPGDLDWRIIIFRPYDFSEYWWRAYQGSIANAFYEHQVTAFGIRTDQTLTDGTEIYLFAHEIRYLEEQGNDEDNPPFANYALLTWRCQKSTEGGNATVSAVWTYDPDTDIPAGYDYVKKDWVPVVVDHFTVWVTGSPGVITETFFVAVIMNRGDLSGPSYGLGIWTKGAENVSYPEPRWIQAHAIAAYGSNPGNPFEEYAGPKSGKPFSGFVQDATDSKKVYFVDEATGQLWSVTVRDDIEQVEGTHITWAHENRGISVHSIEHAVGTPRGVVEAPSDNYNRYFWGMAPGAPGEMALPHPLRPRTIYHEGGLESQYTPLLAHMRWQQGSLYPLVMYSTKCAHVVEVLDLDDMKVWEAMGKLRELAWDYDLFLDADAILQFIKRAASGQDPIFYLQSSKGWADAVASPAEYLLIDPSWKEDTKQVRNAAEGIPHGLSAPGDPDIRSVQVAGSTFSGDYKVKVHNKGAMHLALVCVKGGDLLRGSATDSDGAENFVLFAWRRVLPRIRGILVAPCSTSTTELHVSVGVSEWPNTAAFGDGQAIRTYGGHIRVKGSPWVAFRTISYGGDSQTYLTVDLWDNEIGVDAGIYSEVEIWLEDEHGHSDGDDGVALTMASGGANWVHADDTMIPVSDSRPFKRGMIAEANGEYMEVLETWGYFHTSAWLRVRRGVCGSSPTTHERNQPIKAYVHLAAPNQMYEVGNTRVFFGAFVDTDTQETLSDEEQRQKKAARTISDGDSVVIITQGPELKKMKSSVVRAEDPDSIDLYGRKDVRISNRFLDLVKTDLLCNTIISEDALPKIEIKAMTDLLLSLAPGQTVGVFSTRVVPSGSIESFRIAGMRHDLENRKTAVVLRSYSTYVVPGDVEPVPPPHRPIKRGDRDASAAPPPGGGGQDIP